MIDRGYDGSDGLRQRESRLACWRRPRAPMCPWIAWPPVFWNWRLATFSTEACPIACHCARCPAAPAAAAASQFAAVTRDDAFLLFEAAGRALLVFHGDDSTCFVAGALRSVERSWRPGYRAGMGKAWRLLRDTVGDWCQDGALRLPRAGVLPVVRARPLLRHTVSSSALRLTRRADRSLIRRSAGGRIGPSS